MKSIGTILSNGIIFVINALGVVFIISFFGLTACRAIDASTDETDLKTLEKQRWVLEEIDGQPVLGNLRTDRMGAPGKPYLEFHLPKSRYSGMASCNLISGEIKAQKNEINFQQPTSTVMACDQPLMKQERAVLDFLKQIKRFELENKTLKLYDGDRLLLKLVGIEKVSAHSTPKKVEPQLPAELKLDTAEWVLRTMEGKDLPEGEPELFVNFETATWDLKGSTGCSTFSGGFKSASDSLSLDVFNPLQKLPVRCTEERLARQIKFLEILRSVSRFEIGDWDLNLYDEKNKLLLTFEARNKR